MLWSEVPSIINRNGCFFWRPPSTKFGRHHWIGGPGGHEEPGMLYYVIFCSAGNQKINLPLEDGFYHPLMVSLGIFFLSGLPHYITSQVKVCQLISLAPAASQPFGHLDELFDCSTSLCGLERTPRFTGALSPWMVTFPSNCRSIVWIHGHGASVPTPYR